MLTHRMSKDVVTLTISTLIGKIIGLPSAMVNLSLQVPAKAYHNVVASNLDFERQTSFD